ncbi:PQQ-binding-like beta-propeller repeat protein [Spirillospora sp. NPDC047279]|uniref:outer membrane protein assembly factor BamB family protein n=1 Tax=Spirillospora sp. NPDC047279 TaxID=3155478 RepID=UPI0033DC2C79
MAVATALVVLIMFVAVVRCAPDSSRSAPPLWTLEARAVAGSEKDVSPASWASGPVLAITRARDVTGYDAATGKVRWRLPLAGRVCGASAFPSKGRVAVQFGPDARWDCGRIALVDLASGTKVWEAPITSAAPVWRGQVVMSGDTVVVRWGKGVTALGLNDGKQRWNAPASRSECGAQSLAGGSVLVAAYACSSRASATGSATWHVRELDPATGRPRWSYAVPAGHEVSALPSTGPVIVLLRPEKRPADSRRLVTLTSTGTVRADIPLADRSAIRCDAYDPSNCEGIVVDGETIYTRPGTGARKDVPPIVALSMDGGRARWSTENPDGNRLIPVAMEDGGQRLIAVQPGRRLNRSPRQPPQLVAVDVASGRTTVLWGLDKSIDTNMRLITQAGRHYAQGRFFLVKTSALRNDDETVVSAHGP